MTTITLYIGLILTQAFLGASRLAVRPTIHMIGRRMEAGQLGPLTNSAHTILAQLLTTV
jgi:hypothetical protein